MSVNSKDFGKVGVLYGGFSSERSVSESSGKNVYEALKSAGVDAHLFDLGKQDLNDLSAQQFERVINVLHGVLGEDGSVQGALEVMRLPYTGSGVMASAIAMDKIMTKRIMQEQGIPTPKFHIVKTAADLQQAADSLGYPMILKPPHEGSTLGLTKIHNADELAEALQTAKAFESTLLAEECIIGRELTVAVLGKDEQAKALPVIEIIAPEGNYDFANKYISNDTQYICPAEISEDLRQTLQDYSERLYKSIGCEGWGRVDVMLDQKQQPYVLEINTNPGMTGHSLVPMAAKAAGMSYVDLCLKILSQASCKINITIPKG
ncbi:D-alanine--D-alanine ligase [Brackiella oedipodis]|uniref:D-alanine--D-alanine ligase n=1 Tax=Brackiella oedipodis TaxID=124225 RepID=UPI00048F8954|nr:D-alanine--D-alanine ligase [Brackiella oedipodis]